MTKFNVFIFQKFKKKAYNQDKMLNLVKRKLFSYFYVINEYFVFI